MRNVTDFVKDDQAYFKCKECGAEEIILKYDFSAGYNFATINMQKTLSCIEAFHTKHALCKKAVSQLEIQPL
jgi:hypothetical protein